MKMNSMLVHDRTNQQLKQFLRKPSAGLAIVGEGGTGKEFVARYLAMSLLGVKSAENSPNIHIIDALAVDSAIKTVRELQKKLSLVVISDKTVRQVVIIAHFDAFGHEAQNAMLKTLEEPPVGTVFILTIDRQERVLATIFSRVQSIEVLPISYKDAEMILKPHYTEARISTAYKMSGGVAGLMTGLLEQDTNHQLVAAITESKRLLKERRHIRLAAIDSIIKNNEISAEELLGGTLRIMQVSYKQSLSTTDLKAQKLAHQRVQLILDAMKDLQDGVGQKLVLTRLFFEI